MTSPAIQVLSINGWCRNGSTLIGNALGAAAAGTATAGTTAGKERRWTSD